MEATATPAATKVVNFSELNKLEMPAGEWHHEISVKRSARPRCIYKVFKNIDDIGIYVRLSTQHGTRFMGMGTTTNIVCEGYLYEHKHRTVTTPEIEVIVDEKIQVVASKHDGLYHNTPYIFVKGDKTYLRFYLPHQVEGTLKEDAGVFFIDRFGVRFDEAKPDSYYYNTSAWDTETLLQSMQGFDAKFEDRDQKNRFMLAMVKERKVFLGLDEKKIEGISKTLALVEPFYAELVKDQKDILSIIAFKHAVESSKRTINNVKFSVIINKIFSEIKTKEDFYEKIKEMSIQLEKIPDSKYTSGGDSRSYQERILDSIPEARDIKKAALKRKSTGSINKIMDDLDFIQIDKDKYPLTHEAIFSGEIPKGTFFRKSGDSYFVYNDNWEIWEEILKTYPEIAKAIAAEASRRTTFEKDLMSYFFFVTHKLPEYLEKQTGKKWKGIPKLVNAEKELDPPTEGDNGVAKQRSALTPIVDNDKCEVIVPYVSMRLSGQQTSYCYGLDYNVLERGMSFMGNSVTKDVEKNLNGRDDYGLMFYTLTGSAQAQGYPTFLIIFEHLDTTTKVHFHRTHPMRSKGGDYNPIHGWVIGCYKWMVGNVNFDRIKAQQGDLVFVETSKVLTTEALSTLFPEDKFTEVNAYDNHTFATPVKFLPYTKKEKSNILGYFRIEKDTMLNHNEHKPRLIPAGDYELRQCRSWEANPKGIWSLRID